MSFFQEKISWDDSGWSPDVVPSFGLARISCDLGSPILCRTDPYTRGSLPTFWSDFFWLQISYCHVTIPDPQLAPPSHDGMSVCCELSHSVCLCYHSHSTHINSVLFRHPEATC